MKLEVVIKYKTRWPILNVKIKMTVHSMKLQLPQKTIHLSDSMEEIKT